MQRVAFLCRLAAGLALAVVVVLVAAPASAQKFGEERVLRDLEKEYKDVRKRLFRGDVKYKSDEKDHRDAVDAFAKIAVYRFTLPGEQRKQGGMQAAYGKFDQELRELADLNNKDLGAGLTQAYCRQVATHCLEVIKESGQAIAALNAARVLARLTERPAKQPEELWIKDLKPRLAGGNAEFLAGVYAELIRDGKDDAGKEKKGDRVREKKNDGVRYWALRGLAALLSLPPDNNPGHNKEAEENAVRAALDLAERPVKFPSAAPRAEVEGYKILRREAVRVLAAYRQPRAGEKGLVALTLTRFVGNDPRIVPPPRLDERLEAAIGLAQVRLDPKKTDLNLDYAAQQLARFVVDFASAVGKDKARERDVKAPYYARLRPWKIDAARLLDALQAFKATAEALKSGYALKVLARIVPILEQVERGGTDVQPAELTNWLTLNPPPNKELFKGLPDSTVKEGEAELKTGK